MVGQGRLRHVHPGGRAGEFADDEIAIIGDEHHLATQLRRLADAGATHFIANTSGVTTPAERRRTLEALGALAR